MRYKAIGRAATYRLNVPRFDGGVCASEDTAYTDDPVLADAQNGMWEHGAFRCREALRAVGTAPFCDLDGERDSALAKAYGAVSARPFEVDGKPCTAVVSMAGFTGAAARCLQIVSLDGETVRSYTVPSPPGGSLYAIEPLCVVPCDRDALGVPFLVYYGGKVFVPDDSGGELTRLAEEKLYAPLVMIGGQSRFVDTSKHTITPRDANGVRYEGYNLLTKRFRARFTPNAAAYAKEWYVLPVETDAEASVTVEVHTAYGGFTVTIPPGGTATGTLHIGGATKTYTLTYHTAYSAVSVHDPLPADGPSDTVEITATAKESLSASVRGATMGVWFGGADNRLGGTRLFLAGFDGQAATVRYSDTGNPLYFPENQYMVVGDPSQAITAMDKQEDMLVLFKEREMYYTTYVQGTLDRDAIVNGGNADVTVASAYFPLTQLSPYVGCDCAATLAVCGNRLVWMNRDGAVYTLASATPYSRHNIQPIGQAIAPLLKEALQNGCAPSAMAYRSRYHLQIGADAFSFSFAHGGIPKQPSWYPHRYGWWPSRVEATVVSDGVTALLVSAQHIETSDGGTVRTQHAFVRIGYRFTDDTQDVPMYLRSPSWGAVTAVTETVDIPMRLTTKAYTVGDPTKYKRVAAVWLKATGRMRITAITDGTPSSATAVDAAAIQRVRVGAPRCQSAAFRIESDEAITAEGLFAQLTSCGKVV